MKKTIIIISAIIVFIIVVIVAGSVYKNIKIKSEISKLPSYYQNLIKECENRESYSCCKTSVDRMSEGNFKTAPETGCAEGYQGNMLKCIDSYKWCEPIKG